MTLHLDRAFTDEEDRHFEEAALTWENYSRGYVHITLMHDLDMDDDIGLEQFMLLNEHIVLRVPGEDGLVSETDERLGGHTRAMTINERRTFMFVSRLASGFAKTAMHEMGHNMGMDHVPGRRSVMYGEHQNDSLCPSEEDMKELCRQTGCSLSRVSWCN